MSVMLVAPSAIAAAIETSTMTVGRADFVAGWRQTLQNLDAVHHMITCHVITLDGDRATCSANMQGTHVYTNHSGGPIWTVGGRHDHQLERTPSGDLGTSDARQDALTRPPVGGAERRSVPRVRRDFLRNGNRPPPYRCHLSF